jgi:Sulfotransferase domain
VESFAMSRALDPETRSKLRYVRVSRPDLDLDRFPDFLIVGPQRTGTTWLHAHLRFHPQIFLSEPKELFFFSRLKTPTDPRFQSSDLGWYLRFFDDPWWRWLAKNAITLWRHRQPYRPCVRGEATASYAALDRDVIAEITVLNPNVKVILMIRDPVDRAWSHAKKDLVRKTGRKVDEVPEAELRAFFTDDYQRRCAQYVRNHDNWAAYVREENLLVRAFDEIRSHPERLLLEVMRFLGVSSERRYLAADLRAEVNPTTASAIPEQHRRFLEELLAAELAEVQERFGLSWRDVRASGTGESRAPSALRSHDPVIP